MPHHIIKQIRSTPDPTMQMHRTIGFLKGNGFHIDLPENATPVIRHPWKSISWKYESLVAVGRRLLDGKCRDCPSLECQDIFYYDIHDGMWHCQNEHCGFYHIPVSPESLAAFDDVCRRAMHLLTGLPEVA